MNNKFVFLPISFLILICIVLLALEVPYYSLMIGFLPLLLLAFSIGILVSVYLYRRYSADLDGQYRVALMGNSMLWSSVIVFSIVSIVNRKYASTNCTMISCKIISYTGRYAAGYGKIEKGKIEANQWILEVLVDDKIEQFVLEKNIYQVTDVTSVLPLEFCSGILGTKYLKIN